MSLARMCTDNRALSMALQRHYSPNRHHSLCTGMAISSSHRNSAAQTCTCMLLLQAANPFLFARGKKGGWKFCCLEGLVTLAASCWRDVQSRAMSRELSKPGSFLNLRLSTADLVQILYYRSANNITGLDISHIYIRAPRKLVPFTPVSGVSEVAVIPATLRKIQ